MNAQQIIDDTPVSKNYFELFYPTIFKQNQASENITKILRERR